MYALLMDALEKEHLRRKMAMRMGVFLESGNVVSCVSSHYYGEPHLCELCGQVHTEDIFVIKNRSNKKMRVSSQCLKEMIRFKVTDVEDISKWLTKLSELKTEFEKRKVEALKAREEERKRLEKKVIVRKRQSAENV